MLELVALVVKRKAAGWSKVGLNIFAGVDQEVFRVNLEIAA